MSVPEAEAKGIDVDTLPRADGTINASSPIGTQSSSYATAALDEKMENLKTTDSTNSNVPNGRSKGVFLAEVKTELS